VIAPNIAIPEAMPVTVVGEEAHGSAAWLALRRTGIGGSDAAAALGVSTWMSPYELYLDKLGELPDRVPNASMEWGHLLEPLIVQEYVRRTGRRVLRVAATFRSVSQPYMIADLDGLAEERIVEAKTARTADGWGEPGSDDIPQPYLFQVQHYMAVCRKPVADVAVLIGGSDFRIYEVPADRELQEMLIEGESLFWGHVQLRQPPAVVSIEDARRRWGRLAVRGQVVASDEDHATSAALVELSATFKAMKAEADHYKMKIMERLGDAGDALVDENGRVLITWKIARAAARFDMEAFGREHPELVASYMRPGTPARRFLVKGIEE